MAFLESQFPLLGSIGEYTFYKMKGSDKIIARRKGGPSRKQLKTGKNFMKTRLHSKEFAARVLGSKLVLRALDPLRSIANYNVATALHKPLKAIQDLDTINKLGRRRICFSEHPGILEGLSLNTENGLESMIVAPIKSRISATGEATVKIPRLVPGISLKVGPGFSYFRICVVLAAVPDLHLFKDGYDSPLPDLPITTYVHDTTPWLPVASISAPRTFSLAPEAVPSGNNFVWMLSLGLQFGYPTGPNGIQPIGDEGAAKVIAVIPGGKVL